MELLRVLESARGKDRIIRLSSYVFMLLGGRGNTPLQAKFRKISGELGGCRVMLRLFDDFGMLCYNLASNFGFKQTNPWLRPFDVAGGLLAQVFFPVEHIGWLREKAVLPGNAQVFSLAGLVLWILMLVVEIFRYIINLRVNSFKMKQLKKQKYLEKTEDRYIINLRVNSFKMKQLKKQKYLEKTEDRELNSEQSQQIEDSVKRLRAEQHDIILGIIQSGADLTNAISWLPKGFLWSQKLSPSVNGVCGIIATVLMLYRNWPSKKI